MKQKIVFSFVLLMILMACGNSDSERKGVVSETGKFYPEVEQRSVVIGQIVNIDEFSDAPKKIELAVDDITVEEQHRFITKIDSLGNFKFDIPLYHSIDAYLIYCDGRITPYLFPNDTLRLKCKITKKMFRIGFASGQFDKKHDKFQQNFLKLNRWISYEKINPFEDSVPKELEPEKKKEQYLAFEKQLLKEIDEKTKQDSLSNLLHDYLKYSAKYRIYKDVIRIGEKQIPDKQKRKKFFEFISDSIAFNDKALGTSDYQYFLNFYRFGVEQGKSWRIDTVGKTKKQIIYEAINAKLDTGMSMRKGVWAEILAAATICEGIRMREEVLDKFTVNTYIEYAQRKFKNTYIRQITEALCRTSNEKIKEIQNLTIPKETTLYPQNDKLSGKDIYNKILEDNKGKVIFIDIWGTWCAPCKQKIAYAVRANEVFANKDIAFVYLCCRSEKEPWKKVIKQYQMKGTHYFLNDKQYAFFKNKFSIKGIPHIIFIDRNGQIANPNAPNPKSVRLLPMIDSLLN